MLQKRIEHIEVKSKKNAIFFLRDLLFDPSLIRA